ncbi:MAG: C2 family cysteine protease, partial [Deltaproteobacteria bacterium]|nr:C2 family cysteine protease [Deltaproteobacteria bacterium]
LRDAAPPFVFTSEMDQALEQAEGTFRQFKAAWECINYGDIFEGLRIIEEAETRRQQEREQVSRSVGGSIDRAENMVTGIEIVEHTADAVGVATGAGGIIKVAAQKAVVAGGKYLTTQVLIKGVQATTVAAGAKGAWVGTKEGIKAAQTGDFDETRVAAAVVAAPFDIAGGLGGEAAVARLGVRWIGRAAGPQRLAEWQKTGWGTVTAWVAPRAVEGGVTGGADAAVNQLVERRDVNEDGRVDSADTVIAAGQGAVAGAVLSPAMQVISGGVARGLKKIRVRYLAADPLWSPVMKTLYPHGINRPIRQSNVGDCYLVAGLDGIKRNPLFPGVIDKAIKRVPGGWKVTFEKYPGEVITVTDQDLNGQVVKKRGRRVKKEAIGGDLGDRLLERAYGKLRKTLKGDTRGQTMIMVEGGFGHHFAEDLTGWPRSVVTSGTPGAWANHETAWFGAVQKGGRFFKEAPDRTRQDLYRVLLDKAKNPDGLVLTAATPNLHTKFFSYGLKEFEWKVEKIYFMDPKKKFICGHAYTITDVKVDEATGKVASVRVINPWDTGANLDLTLDQFEEIFNLVGINRP